ncbi:MAG: PhoH family protein [Clostridiales bacterium]|nr:PhoH family protein [Clostridiales bacterium]
MKTNIEVENVNEAIALFGNHDENVNYLRRRLEVNINLFDNSVVVEGEDEKVERCARLIALLLEKSRTNTLNRSFINFCIEVVENGDEDKFDELCKVIALTARGKQIKSKTYGQAKYVQAIRDNGIVFGIGPAGTGKTYLAVAIAVAMYRNKIVEKIILTRPAVEAGEKLGFLPGDLGAKVDPYLKPLYDALQEMFGLEVYSRLIEKGVIEIAPLAYMRGRTLSNAFIILDEAQNTTREQMKMFLTRMGEGSRIVVTGDATQIDLPNDKSSGLLHASKILQGIDNIQIVHLKNRDIVRNDLVQAIVKAYEESKNNQEKELK